MTILLKLLLAPLLVVMSSLAGRRWGEQVAGVLVAFPIVAGPILLITSLEHGTRFGARAASASLLGLVSLAVFVVSFAYAARRWKWAAALAVSWAATVLADIALVPVAVGAAWGFIVVLVTAGLAYRLVTALERDLEVAGSAPAPWWDLPGRAVVTAGLVVTITGISDVVGAVVTGILAPFPIATSVVAAFVLAQQGPAATLRTLAGVTRGLVGFAVFCFLLAVLLVPCGVLMAFTLAIVATLLVQLSWPLWGLWTSRRPLSRAG